VLSRDRSHSFAKPLGLVYATLNQIRLQAALVRTLRSLSPPVVAEAAHATTLHDAAKSELRMPPCFNISRSPTCEALKGRQQRYGRVAQRFGVLNAACCTGSDGHFLCGCVSSGC
jgi:hypothetical protein